ncbi:hypothetical protein KDK_79710 [Dictyobacter kobayashii]|uniref:Uncharacterized protein n=1 Tax=Dictyobacter kobayashii TaxID=2014872 RepID=A0A402AYH0_9CHLR|nr:hypothetical protein KDK_79710 [Dictyobacter kobayashii]
MEEDYLAASLAACPCHQLRAHESRAEAHILWVDTATRERAARMNTGLSRDSLLLCPGIKL